MDEDLSSNEILSSLPYGEEAGDWRPGFLSVLLFSPLSVLLAGVALIFGLSQIHLEDSFQPLESAPNVEEQTAIAPLFTEEIQRWEAEIESWAAEMGLDPNLVATVMQIESCGDPRALSPAGAMGLFQVMPYHFAEGENPYEPAVNALRGLNYLRRSLAAFEGDAGMALAGYNGGINGASRPQSEWAAETRGYLYWGSGIYADAMSGAGESERLAEWLQAGGASLCAQAAISLDRLVSGWHNSGSEYILGCWL